MVKKLANVSVRDKAYAVLKEAIINGELAPGERIIEDNLASTFGVSRTPLREAIHVLENEGFFMRKDTKGVVVALLTEKEAKDLYQVRSDLEGLAARLVALNMSPVQEKKLNNIYAEIKKYASENKFQDVYRECSKVHDFVREYCDNSVCVSFLKMMDARIACYKKVSLKYSGRQEIAYKQHLKIIESLIARDADGSEKAMHDHIISSFENIISVIKLR